MASILSASLCAGISTVTVNGPWKTPRVAAITGRGDSGSDSGLSARRYRLLMKSSIAAIPAASSRAPAAATMMATTDGAAVSYMTENSPNSRPSCGGRRLPGPRSASAIQMTTADASAMPRTTRPIPRLSPDLLLAGRRGDMVPLSIGRRRNDGMLRVTSRLWCAGGWPRSRSMALVRRCGIPAPRRPRAPARPAVRPSTRPTPRRFVFPGHGPQRPLIG